MSAQGQLPPSETWAATRAGLQRVAVHVLARRRAGLVGRFGLRVVPGGIATPAAGPEHEVVRTSGPWLIRERTGATAHTQSLDLSRATLAEAAALVEVDLAAPLDVGHDTPPVGDPHAPLGIDAQAAGAVSAWFAFGWRVLDEVLATLGPEAAPSVVQLWPEHFDAGCDVAAGAGRVNLGASPGDAAIDEPYLYVGPWGEDRPGDAAYWNEAFGAVLGHAALAEAPDPHEAAVAFLRRGVRLLADADADAPPGG